MFFLSPTPVPFPSRTKSLDRLETLDWRDACPQPTGWPGAAKECLATHTTHWLLQFSSTSVTEPLTTIVLSVRSWQLAQKHRLMTSASSMGVQMARSRMTPGCLTTTSV